MLLGVRARPLIEQIAESESGNVAGQRPLHEGAGFDGRHELGERLLRLATITRVDSLVEPLRQRDLVMSIPSLPRAGAGFVEPAVAAVAVMLEEPSDPSLHRCSLQASDLPGQQSGRRHFVSRARLSTQLSSHWRRSRIVECPSLLWRNPLVAHAS